MINLFQAAAQDQSIVYLGALFGNMGGVIPVSSASSIALLGAMFSVFNGIVLTVGALVVVYVTVMGVMFTAQEGEFMGKKWGNLWMPIRTVLGIVLLVPTSTGYCSIQIIMMWVILQGVGAADTLWNTALSYVNIMGSPYAQGPVPSAGVSQTMVDLFKGLTCHASATLKYDDPTPGAIPYFPSGGGYYCKYNPGCGLSEPRFDSSVSQLKLGPGGACGTLSYCTSATCGDPTSLKCQVCQEQLKTLTKIVPIFYKIASDFTQADYQYRQWYVNSSNSPGGDLMQGYCDRHTPPIPTKLCCIPSIQSIIAKLFNTGGGTETACTAVTFGDFPPTSTQTSGMSNAPEEEVREVLTPYIMEQYKNTAANTSPEDQASTSPRSFIDTATKEYIDSITAITTNYINQQITSGNNLGGFADAAQYGWIFAGSYYYKVANGNASLLELSIPNLTFIKNENSIMFRAPGFRHNSQAAETFLSSGDNFLANLNSSLAPLGNPIADQSAAVFNTIKSIININTTGQNALVQIQAAGQSLLLDAQIIFWVFFGLMIVLAAVAGWSATTVLGSGSNVLEFLVQMATFLILPLVFFVCGILVTYGGLLGVYTPLIPYIIFTMGAISWLISTIEAMIAGPLVALGVLSPSQGHELLGKAEPALMHLFFVFLRPSLMIFAMMAAMLLSTIGVVMLNVTFGTVMAAMNSHNLLSSILFLGAYIGLLVAILNKCFGVISVVPQQVMRWIGAGHAGEGAGAEEALKGGQEGVQAAGRGATAAGSGLASGGAKAGGMGAAGGAKNKAKKAAETKEQEDHAKQTSMNVEQANRIGEAVRNALKKGEDE